MVKYTLVALSAAMMLLGGAARADSFFIGFNSSPAPRYTYYPQSPVVVMQPRPAYTYYPAPRVVYSTPAYYYAPPRPYCPPGHWHHHHHEHYEDRGYYGPYRW